MNMFVIMSHTLTKTQVDEIKNRFNIENIIYLPEQLKEIWGNIPPQGEWDFRWLKPIKKWLGKELKEGDRLIVQGEFGATYSLVSWLQKQGFSVYYATSERRVVETVQGDQVLTQRIFEHVNFREYPGGGDEIDGS